MSVLMLYGPKHEWRCWSLVKLILYSQRRNEGEVTHEEPETRYMQTASGLRQANVNK